MMGNRPAVDHHHTDQHLAVARLAITTMSMFGQPRRPVPLEVRRRQIVEDQIHVERKQRAQSAEQLVFELRLVPHQPVQRADGDGDLDVVVVSVYKRWNDPAAQSLVWLENSGQQQFTMHDIASSPTHLIALSVGDLDGNGTADLVTGGMHISGPYDRMSRVTVWSNRGSAARR